LQTKVQLSIFRYSWIKALIMKSVKYILLIVLISLLLIIWWPFNISKNVASIKDGYQLYSADSTIVKNGLELFNGHCASCHSMKYEGIGPKLGGITTIIDKSTLMKFITDPSKVLDSGNLRASYLKARYKSIMPPFIHLDQQNISDILSYIDFETKKEKLTPFIIDTTQQFTKGDRILNPIIPSGLSIELEDFVQIPLATDRSPDKGLATLRANPSGNGTLFISDQMGVIHKVKDGSSQVYLNVRDVFSDFIFKPGVGTGLGSFDFHPDFLNNGLIYTTHAEEYKGKIAINHDDFAESVGVGLQWVLTEWTLEKMDSERFVGSHREVLRVNTPTTAHGFQDIGFSPVRDKQDSDYAKLYIGIGDGGSVNLKKPELCNGNTGLLGALLRIDPHGANGRNGQYGIPEDNPFANHSDKKVKKELWAFGFRNPHRFCWDMSYGKRMILADIGEANVEEINIVEKGWDYGWSNVEGTMGIDVMADKKDVYSVGSDYLRSYHLPFGQFDHMDGKAISGGFVYKGNISELQNKYIFGDIVSGDLFYMNIDENLSDSTIYSMNVVYNGIKTGIQAISDSQRSHLRIGYDSYKEELFIMTKANGMVRKVTKAFYEQEKLAIK
jgi:glucose/arabinose dehydrogenase